MSTVLALGFLLGVRHALESDHIAAVAALAADCRSVRHTVLQGAVWGLGHAVTLLLACSTVLYLHVLMPKRLADGLELAVALMVVGLGVDTIHRARRNGMHLHLHRHRDGTRHIHVHSHRHDEGHGDVHDHAHPQGFPLRALCVGMMHGLAGSAALIVLALPAGAPALAGLSYVILFGVGSIAGMALFSTVVAVPLRCSAERFKRCYRTVQEGIGLLSVGVGVVLLANNGLLAGLAS
jgi:ABC-type nickel/cobalt efflux system permease component RcnA